MALINIGYGSIASSETMNSNFAYLDDRISDSNTSIMGSISSILSNIATINARITELSETLSDSLDTADSKLEGYKTKTKLLVAEACMVPNWSARSSINLVKGTAYTVTSNGYVLVIPVSNESGNITVNSNAVEFKYRNNNYDNSADMMVIPVKKGDSVTSGVSIRSSYFVPAAEVSVENF